MLAQFQVERSREGLGGVVDVDSGNVDSDFSDVSEVDADVVC